MAFAERYSALHLALDSLLESTGRKVAENPDGPLAEGAFAAHLLDEWFSDRPRTAALRRLLLAHLPRLRPKDAAHLTCRHRDRLYFELRRKRNEPALVVAILQGLSGLRDRDAERYVRPLADGRHSAGGYPAVQDAARVFLDTITGDPDYPAAPGV